MSPLPPWLDRPRFSHSSHGSEQSPWVLGLSQTLHPMGTICSQCPSGPRGVLEEPETHRHHL